LDVCKGFLNGKKAHICQISADVLAICSQKIMIKNHQISAIRFRQVANYRRMLIF
jgi:hypothetical protein